MKNLFIMHTQYNLILSAAITTRYPNAENTLVLFSEFPLDSQMQSALEGVFHRVLIARDHFANPELTIDIAKEIRTCLRRVKVLQKEAFDHVYISQERIFDNILWSWAKKNNPAAQCYNIEEDAYYSINETYNQPDFVFTESKRSAFHNFRLAMLLLPYRYDYRQSHYCYGMSSIYHGAKLLFPQLARRELQNKEKDEITCQELLSGIQGIYGQKQIQYPQAEKYTLFFFDLMNRYKNPECVKAIVREILSVSQLEGRTVLFKYHPRETEKFTDLADVHEIPHLIPAEKVLYDLQGKDTVVIGNATTACIVAAKLGFQVVSICKLESPNNKKMHSIMQQMNIFCIENENNIKYLFAKENVK